MRKIFFTLVSLFWSYLIFILPFNILNHLMVGTSIFSISSFVICIIFYVLLIFFFSKKSQLNFFRVPVYLAIGIGFLSLNISILAYIIHFITPLNSFNLGVLGVTLIILLTLIGSVNGITIKEKELEFISSKIERNYKLIFISDVHLGSNSAKYLKEIIKIIKRTKYDALIIGGDLVDSSSFNIDNFKMFKTLKKKILYVTGNHEFYLNNSEKIFKSLVSNNIQIIDNKKIQIDDINVIGIGDNTSYKDRSILISKLNMKEKFNILVSHKPIFWDESHDKIDLMLSGHTHNGQIFPFNFLVKIKFKYIYGIYQKKKSSLYVSSGIGCWGPRMRLGTQNELVSVSVIKEK